MEGSDFHLRLPFSGKIMGVIVWWMTVKQDAGEILGEGWFHIQELNLEQWLLQGKSYFTVGRG